MPYLDVDFPTRVRATFGDKVADGVSITQQNGRDFLSGVGNSFTFQGAASPIAISTEDPVIDLGGARPNDAALATPAINVHDTPVGRRVAALVGYPLNKDNLAVTLYAHRFIDAGATRLARRLATTVCPGLYCVTVRPNGVDVDLVFVDGQDALMLEQDPRSPRTLRQRLDAVTPERSSLSDADLDNVYAITGDRIRRVPVTRVDDVSLPIDLSDGVVRGSQNQRLSVARTRNPEDAGPAPTNLTAPPASNGSRNFAATTSRIIGISGEYGGGPNAPNGYVWGDPFTVGKCSRSSRDECLNCCQNIGLAYAGAAVTSVVTGLGAGAAVAGVGAIPGVIVGGIIGGVIGLAGFVHFTVCRNDCNTLYSTGTGEPVQNTRFRLTAAEYDDEGNQVAYRVVTENPDTESRWTVDQVSQFVWARANVIADSGVDQAPVAIVRKAGGDGFYLRSARDRRILNNLAELPAIR